MDKKQRSTRIKITERALFQRINRKLHQQGKNLRTDRNPTGQGRHYIVDSKGSVERLRRGLEPLAREMGLLESWEEVG